MIDPLAKENGIGEGRAVVVSEILILPLFTKVPINIHNVAVNCHKS